MYASPWVNINGGTSLLLSSNNSRLALLLSIVERIRETNLADYSGADSGVANAYLYVGNNFFGNIIFALSVVASGP